MLIYDRAIKLYKSDGKIDPERTLQADIAHYMRVGYVVCTPETFLMGRRVACGWWIYVAIGTGTLKTFFDHMPYYLPWVGWARPLKGRPSVSWHHTNKVLRKLGYDSDEFANRRPDPTATGSGRRTTGDSSATSTNQGKGGRECAGHGRAKAQRIPVDDLGWD